MAKVCVEFGEPEITGEELLARSELRYSINAANPMGVLVCSIEGSGCLYPEEDCFCECNRPGSCSYWSYFTRRLGEGWSYSVQGASQRRVKHGDLDAWVWISSSGPGEARPEEALAAIAFEDVCR